MEALHEAVSSSEIEAVRSFLSDEKNWKYVNACDRLKRRALHIAIFRQVCFSIIFALTSTVRLFLFRILSSFLLRCVIYIWISSAILLF